jgi:hypothetical protein
MAWMIANRREVSGVGKFGAMSRIVSGLNLSQAESLYSPAMVAAQLSSIEKFDKSELISNLE